MVEEWKGSRAQRDALRERFGGRCGYCGDVLVKMQADHIEPVIRITTDPWGQPLPASACRLIRPERNVVSNMMPSCAPCNNSKGGYRLEDWRKMLARSAEIVAQQKPIFKAGVRFGVIRVTGDPVVFHFERVENDAHQLEEGQADG